MTMFRRYRRKIMVLVSALALLTVLGLLACEPPFSQGIPKNGLVQIIQKQVGLDSSSQTTGAPDPAPSPTSGAPSAASQQVLPASGDKNSGPLRLHTDKQRIVDANGNEVIITGVNWFGMETDTYAPHGLWSRNWEEMLDQVVALGFNALRLPYSNQLFDANSKPNGIDFAKNPDLQGLTGLEIMDKIVAGATQRGLMVILDRHRPDANGQSALWYTDHYGEDRWIKDWVMLAQRYRDNPLVIGADLHNEPHGEATWGSGDPRTDWRLAAERAGNAILDVNPDWLIFVEGIEKYGNDYYWWGGQLMGAADYPVRLKVPNRLVYSAHDYGPGVSGQRWFTEPNFPLNLPPLWNAHWGYLVQQGIAPVWVGEFGGRSVGQDTEGIWQRSLFAYLKENRLSYTYWTLNPNSGDTGGVLNDDWQTVNAAKMAVIAGYQAPLQRQAAERWLQTLPTPTPAPAKKAPDQSNLAPTMTPTKVPVSYQPSSGVGLKVLYHSGRNAADTNELAPEIQVLNQSSSPVALKSLVLRYWFAAEDLGSKTQILDVDWSNFGAGNVRGQFVANDYTSQGYYLELSFSSDAVLPPGESLELKSRVHKSDWSNYLQTNDYSYRPSDTYAEWARITLYLDGKLVWGQEPTQ